MLTVFCYVINILTSSFVTSSSQETPNMLLCNLRWAASSRFNSVAVTGTALHCKRGST